MKTAVIIPAAGAGQRFGGDVKKPFAQLDNRPVFLRSIELFLTRDDVCQVILAVSPDDYEVVREKYAAQIMFMEITLVAGGNERFESVRKALAAVSDEAELIAVHDAVRPCVTDKWIDDVFARAGEHGAAILAAPLVGTIKRVAETVDRRGLYEAQTPQVFRREILTAAYEALPDDASPTDDAEVVERTGQSVAIVETDRRNLKITTKSDMTLASVILKGMPRKPKDSGPRNPFEEAQW